MRDPEKACGGRFKVFVEDEHEVGLLEVLALKYRAAIIRTGLGGVSFRRMKELIVHEQRGIEIVQDLTLKRVLAEYAAIFIVMEGGHNLKLRSLLGLTKMTREEAFGLPKEAFDELESYSAVTLELQAKLPDKVSEFGTGEDLRSPQQWRDLVKLKQGARALTTTPSFTTLTQHGGASLWGWLDSPHRLMLGTGTRPRKLGNPHVSGPIFVQDRCRMCLSKGHRGHECSRPSAEYRKTNALWLLNEASHGRVALPPA